MTTLLFAVAGVSLLLALHPYLIFPLSLRWMERRRAARDARAGRSAAADAGAGPRAGPPAAPASIAILMCAYNEERVIETKVRNLLALRDEVPDLQILIYVDAASDRTAEILRRYDDRITLHVSPERHGKTYGMNLLVGRAEADILVFTDATIEILPGSMRALQAHFADPAVGCVCGWIDCRNPDASVTTASAGLYSRLDIEIRRLESLDGSVIGAHGGLFAVRRALHRSPPDDIIDDLYVSLNVLADGHRVIQSGGLIGVEDAATDARDEFHRKVRIACQSFNVHRLLWPRIRRLRPRIVYQYLSHKLLRWLTIYFLAIGALAFEGALVLAGYSSAAAICALLGLTGLFAGLRGWSTLLARIVDLLGALAGTGLGVWRSIRGQRFQTWTPAASVRKQ
ncbi:MAG TPA: glycosyltransferase [Burkholderiaceae bacterium]|nr:glycosyltransferase [Burkholderiaceae bacterium]